MRRKSSLTAGALLLLALTTLPPQGNAEEKESEHLRANLNVIRIGRSDVFPGTAKVRANEAAVWTNYSGTAVGIRFDKEAVKKLHCKEQSPFLSSGEVRSAEVVTLCQFAPGEYEYTVRRRHSPSFPRGGTTSSMGKISVSQSESSLMNDRGYGFCRLPLPLAKQLLSVCLPTSVAAPESLLLVHCPFLFM